MCEHGLSEQLIGDESFEPRHGYESMTSWLEAGGEVPDAVFAANDFLAVGVVRALHAHGLRVPEDVAVAGFDNSIDADFLIPRIGSVEQNFGELVEESLELLVGAMAGEEPRTVLISPELVVRESSVR